MKIKPDVSSFQQPPRKVDDFLEGAVADRRAEPQNVVTIPIVKPEPTVQKMFRLNWNVAQALKTGAAHESAREGRRVTETEIVERLISEHYKLSI